MQFRCNNLWFADNCNRWSTSSLLCSNMRRSPLETYELIGRVFGTSASSAGGPGFRHVPSRGILTARLWFSPFSQSKCRNVTSKCLRLFIHLFIYTKKKVKWSRYRPGVAQTVGSGIALLFHDRGTRSGWVVSSTPRPHFTSVKAAVPTLEEAEWAPRPVWTGCPRRDSIPDRPAPSQSLYRLSYRAHYLFILCVIKWLYDHEL